MNPQGSSIEDRPLEARRFGPSLLSALVLAALLPLSAASADTDGYYIETINRTSEVQGEPATEELTKTYVAYDKMAVINEGADATNMIMDPDAGTIIFVNHAEKEYLPIDIKAVMESMSGPAGEQMRAMMGNMTVKVEATDETKQIGDWNTRLYRVSKTGMVGVQQEVWAAEDVDIDVTRYTDMMSMSGPAGLLASSPEGIAQREEMSKIKGYPILTKTTMEMMGTTMQTETEVKVIRKEPVAEDLFKVPEGYGVREMQMEAPPAGSAHP